jgi:hypothetical protein
VSDLKRALLSIMVVGFLAWITIPRTYAVFNTEAGDGASITSGTLLEGNSTNGGADCDSTNGASSNKNTTCSALMTYSTSSEYYPGGPAATATVTIKAKGTLDATDLKVDMPSCSTTATGDAPAAQQGSGNPCVAAGAAYATLTILETTTGNVHCVYPNSGATCTPDTTKGVYNFFSNYAASTAALDLGSGPAAGGSRSFTISFALPSTAPAAMQGVSTLFTLEWFMTNG